MLKEWREIYCTAEMEKCFQAKILLEERNIKYKIDKIDNNLRLSINHLGGGIGIALSRDKNIKDFYRISVKKRDESQARFLLSQIEP